MFGKQFSRKWMDNRRERTQRKISPLLIWKRKRKCYIRMSSSAGMVQQIYCHTVLGTREIAVRLGLTDVGTVTFPMLCGMQKSHIDYQRNQNNLFMPSLIPCGLTS